jgi:hypothetical protein
MVLKMEGNQRIDIFLFKGEDLQRLSAIVGQANFFYCDFL